jgi:hypothetical protein
LTFFPPHAGKKANFQETTSPYFRIPSVAMPRRTVPVLAVAPPLADCQGRESAWRRKRLPTVYAAKKTKAEPEFALRLLAGKAA